MPKVSPAVPELTLVPCTKLSVWAPMVSPLKVWVTPAPVVSRSDAISTAPVMVVGRLKLRPVSLANCRVPPDSVKMPAPKAPALVVARSVPALSVVPPVCKLFPERTKVPAPDLTSRPVVAALAPVISRELAVTSRVPVVPAPSVKLRSVEAVAPVYRKVPPPKTKFAAALVAAPKFPLAPPLPIVATDTVPAVNVVTPVYVLVPDSVRIPAPALVKPPAPFASAPVLKVVLPAPPTVSPNAPVTPPDSVKVSASELICAALPKVIAPA